MRKLTRKRMTRKRMRAEAKRRGRRSAVLRLVRGWRLRKLMREKAVLVMRMCFRLEVGRVGRRPTTALSAEETSRREKGYERSSQQRKVEKHHFTETKQAQNKEMEGKCNQHARDEDAAHRPAQKHARRKESKLLNRP